MPIGSRQYRLTRRQVFVWATALNDSEYHCLSASSPLCLCWYRSYISTYTHCAVPERRRLKCIFIRQRAAPLHIVSRHSLLTMTLDHK